MCCGNKKSAVRSVNVKKTTKKREVLVTNRKSNKSAATPMSIDRQYSVPRQSCPKCGSPLMLVHIAGRERSQCTNINCKFVIR